jgi:hypothetical protein
MQRPWVKPEQVKEYTSSSKVMERPDVRLSYDIARAERYVIFHTHNKFNTEEYGSGIPSDVSMAVILLAEAYAKQAISQKDGNKSSETFDDYSYTMDTDADIADGLGLGAMLDDYVIEDKGRAVMKLRKL